MPENVFTKLVSELFGKQPSGESIGVWSPETPRTGRFDTRVAQSF